MGQTSCSGCTLYQVTAPGTQTVPANGTITTWRASGNGRLALRVLRTTGSSVAAVATSPVVSVTGSSTLAVSLPVLAGDRIGVDLESTGSVSAQLHLALGPGTYGLVAPATPDGAPVMGSLSNGGGSGQLNVNADVALAPVASALNVASGPTTGGTAVTITGTYLDGVTSVRFGGQPASFTLGPAGQLLVTTPPSPTAGPVDVVVQGPGGSSTLAGAFTYLAPPTPIVTDGGSTTPVSQSPATGSPGGPVLKGLALLPSAFVPARGGASLVGTNTGTRLSYAVSAAASTRFAVQQLSSGRLVRGRGGQGSYCQPARYPVPAKFRCTRSVPLPATFTHEDRAGANVLHFTGRLGSRTLAPGSYRLVATATDAQGRHSAPVTHAFRILGPAPRP